MEKNKKKLMVSCPHCKISFQYYSSEFRPFCSERCKMVDMGMWLEEAYQIKGPSFEPYIEIDDDGEYEE